MMRALTFALLGGFSGALAAAAADLLRFGDAPGFWVFGHCVGLGGPDCRGTAAGLYLYPGLVFGLVFAVLLVARARLRFSGAVAFATIATLANAVAVVVWTALFVPLGRLFEGMEYDSQLIFAVGGAAAGACGGGLLGYPGRRLLGLGGGLGPTLGGGGLGLLLPLLLPMLHGYAFYIVWQGGYAAALLSPRPARGAAQVPVVAH